jgi:hypothetical protein
MGSRPLGFTVGKPIPAAQAAPSSANVVSFNRHGRPRAKFEPITSSRSSKVVMPPSSAAVEGGTSGSYGPKGVIIDFAHASRGGHAAKGHKFRAKKTETDLTVADYAAIAYVVMSVAFYPALAFLFSS